MKTGLRFLICIFSLTLLLNLYSLAAADNKKPVDIKKGDKCQVCGMLVYPFPNWAAEILFSDGTYAAFDGAKDMFRYYLNLHKYNPSKKQSDIAAFFVTEYYSAKMMDARQVFFVSGSDVNGPMGAELVAIESAEKAKVFLKDHKGKKILKFGEVGMEAMK